MEFNDMIVIGAIMYMAYRSNDFNPFFKWIITHQKIVIAILFCLLLLIGLTTFPLNFDINATIELAGFFYVAFLIFPFYIKNKRKGFAFTVIYQLAALMFKCALSWRDTAFLANLNFPNLLVFLILVPIYEFAVIRIIEIRSQFDAS